MMTCDLCMRKTSRGHLTPYGMACPVCIDTAQEREDKLYAELLAENVVSMPPFLEVSDFERLVLKLSLHSLRKMTPKDRMIMADRAPILLNPRDFSLHLKEQILEQMPRYYVSEMDSVGHTRMFHGGTYVFKCKVPDRVIFKALEKADLIARRGGPDGQH